MILVSEYSFIKIKIFEKFLGWDYNGYVANKTVLVGISGGIRSMVAAYILKRQKCNVVGVSILFSDGEDTLLNRNREELEAFFQNQQIPYHQIQVYDRYSSHITDFICSSRISGHLFCARTAASALLLDTLASQMARFKAEKMATGHCARVVHNHQAHTPEIYRFKDTTDDQSHLLTFSPPEQLSRLELPLTGMQPDDIEKVADILKIAPYPPKSFLEHTCQNLAPMLEKRIPPTFRQKGDILDYFDRNTLGTHHGLHHFSPGIPLPSQAVSPNDDGFNCKQMIPVQIIWQRNQLVVMDKDRWIPCTHIVLSHCQYFSRFEHKLPPPSNLTIRINATKPLPVRIRQLNNRNVLCILKKPYPSPLFPQMSAVIYDDEKVALGGKIFQAGHLGPGPEMRLRSLPSREDQDGGAPPPRNHSSFKF